MSPLLPRLAASLLLVAATAIAKDEAEPLLQFELRSSGTTVLLKGANVNVKEGATPDPKKFSSRWRVSLRRGSIATLNLDTGEETLLDRKGERLVIFDHKNKRVRTAYLLGWIAALDQEKANRVRISGAMQSAGIDDPAFATFWIESLFRTGSEAADEVKATNQDAARQFTYEKKVVASFAPGAIAIPAPLRSSWKLFLIRTMKLHPAIHAEVAALDALPARLQYQFVNVGKLTETVYEFGPWPGANKSAPVDLTAAQASYSAWVDPKDPLDVLLADIAAKRVGAEPITQAKYEAQIKQLITDKQHLSAFLLLMEARFAYQDLPARELIGAIEMDGQQLLPVLQILRDGQSDPAAAAKALHEFPREGIQGTSTLDILEANALVELQKPDEAQALFLKVLRDRSWLAGPWKDLGDLYARRYRMAEAWRCWEFGLALSPEHPLLRPFDGVRRDLRARYISWLKES